MVFGRNLSPAYCLTHIVNRGRMYYNNIVHVIKMDLREAGIQKMIMNGTLIHEHVNKTPDNVLLNHQDTYISCSIADIKLFRQTQARDALLDQLSNIKTGQVVIGCYVNEDFLSYVVELKAM